MVEQLFRKQQVTGSNPVVGFRLYYVLESYVDKDCQDAPMGSDGPARWRPFAMLTSSSHEVVPVPSVCVVPAAGLGTRLRPLTAGVLPKEMLPVGRKLALEHIVDELSAAGITRIIFVLSPAKEEIIRRHFGDGDAGGIHFVYALQPEMRGLGDAILCARPFLEDSVAFAIALGDAVFEEPSPGTLMRRLLQTFTAEQAAVGLAVQRVDKERISRYGVVRPTQEQQADKDFLHIDDIVEKPSPEEAPSDLAAAARYVVGAEALGILERTPPAKNGEVQLTDALRTMLHSGGAGVATPLRSREIRHDLGGLDSYFKAFVTFALRDPDYGGDLRGWLEARRNDVDAVVEERAGE